MLCLPLSVFAQTEGTKKTVDPTQNQQNQNEINNSTQCSSELNSDIERARQIDMDLKNKGSNTYSFIQSLTGLRVVFEGVNYEANLNSAVLGYEKIDDAKPHGSKDDSGPFDSKEVIKKAVITYQPRPEYTEEAKKNVESGIVKISAVLYYTGVVTDITVIKGLKYGLTERAIEATQGIKFIPAQKDGRNVSQHAHFEYNFVYF